MKKQILIANIIVSLLLINAKDVPKEVKADDLLVFSQFWFPASTYGMDWSHPPRKSKAYIPLMQSDIRHMFLYKELAGQQLSIHGLWPSDKNSCNKDKIYPETLPINIRKALIESFSYSNFVNMARHEWYNHGTCYGGSPTEYFSAVLNYQEKNPTPDFFKNNIGKVVSYDDLLKSFGGNDKHTIFTCGNDLYGVPQYIREVRTIWNMDGSFAIRKDSDKRRGECDNTSDVFIAKAGKFITTKEHVSTFKKYKKGTAIGFDLDRTLLFSSVIFNYASNHFKVNSEEYWKYVNSYETSVNSIVKKEPYRILMSHRSNGHHIYFITERSCENKEGLLRYLSEAFDISNPDLICTKTFDKSEAIKENNITMYYGDADTDVYSAILAGAKPIRILRSKILSDGKVGYHTGFYGEDAILASDM